MTTLREAVAQALDALTEIHPGNMTPMAENAWLNAVQILREALAEPEPEPLTDEEIAGVMQPFESVEPEHPFWVDVARAIERAHGIGGEK